MSSTRITPKSDVNGTSIDLSIFDVDEALQRGRNLRSQAFGSFFKSLFHRFKSDRGQQAERGEHKGSLSPDCAAAA